MQLTETRNSVSGLATRIDTLETKFATMSDKFDAARISLENLLTTQKVKHSGVMSHPSDARGAQVNPIPASSDPEAGFVNDDATQAYRKALILIRASKYPESVLAFSSFLERFADHPLAGSAQFYIGEAYFLQKEFKLAIDEFQRLLTSYDRSAHVADTLKRMSEAEDALKDSQNAAKHRQLLTSLFPQSPAASSTASSPVPANENPPTAPVPDPVPESKSGGESGQ